MFSALIITLIGIGWAAYNWYLESKPYVDNMYKPVYSKYTIIAIFQGLGATIINFGRLFTDGKFLLLDIAITIFAVEVISFGHSFIGGAIGIYFSNAISLLILMNMKRQGKLSSTKKPMVTT